MWRYAASSSHPAQKPMLRTKITELGNLNFLDDGGLVCSVTLLQAPSLEASVRAASLYWAPTDPGELAIGDLVAHSDHGVARYRGRKSIANQKCDYLELEFAGANRLFVPVDQSGLLQKLRGADRAPIKLSTLGAEGGKWSQSYCVEALPSAYEWPGIGKFPKLPQESTPDAMAEWRRACATYQKALHAEARYRQAAQEYFERQNREPQPLLDWWVYRAMVLRVEPIESANVRNRDEHLLLIKQYVLRRERKVEKIRREVETLENCGSLEGAAREPIPENVRLFVWQRDKGQCVRCGSRERLEFDHIIPVVAGGSNTERNIQLLCESCNRSKSSTV
jgi:5-methylcytosine-specific restriction endonuclease McrA